jgi:DNA helicase-2/ATP-dependent DNA helicase PcrA
MSPTLQQQIAITAEASSIFLEASAGSGKTTVLKERIAKLVRSYKAIPSMILALTFSRKAANEIQQRLEDDGIFGVNVTTFHSWCYAYLTKNNDIHYSILDDSAQKTLIKKLIPKGLEIKPKEVINWINLQKTKMLRASASLTGQNKDFKVSDLDFSDPDSDDWAVDHLDIDVNFILSLIYRDYEQYCIEHKLMDFGEMEFRCYESLKKYGHQGQYRHLLIDEYQDTSPVEWEIIKLINTYNIFAVGDPKQRIYEFRGAYAGNIDDFIEYFGATKLYLTINFRSTKQIVNNADDIYDETFHRMEAIKDGQEVFKKSFDNESDEVQWTARQIERIIDNKEYSVALLFRKKVNIVPFENALLNKGIKVNVVGARPFLSYAEIQDCLAWLQYAWNPENTIALSRLLGMFPGIGDATIERILNNDFSKQATVDKYNNFKYLLGEVQDILDYNDLYEAIPKIIEITELLSNYKDKIDDRKERLKKLAALGGNKDMPVFLEEIASEPMEDNNKSVKIMTIHKAKGLEFGCVFIPCNETGVLPADDSESEKNVVHVAMTRAEELLILTSSGCRVEYGQRQFKEPSKWM